jgi:hypothetical protein
MVGHDYKGVENVLAEDGFTSMYSSHDARSDTRIFEPERTRGGFVQVSVKEFECSSGSVLGLRGVGGTATPGCALR